MIRAVRRRWAIVIGGLLGPGCSVVIGDLEPPAMVDAVADARADALLDAAVLDGGPDAWLDGAVDAAPDAAPDAGPPDATLVDARIDAAPRECPHGAVEDRPCGLNGRGVESRSCDAGRWGDFSACADPDECVDGAAMERACGLNARGMQIVECAEGRFSVLGECMDPDVCVNGEEEIEACPGALPGIERSRACVAGQWTEWTVCVPCLPGMSEDRICGLNGRGTQTRDCLGVPMWSEWSPCDDPDECVDGAVDVEDCIRTLTRERTCVEGRWGAFDDCRRRD